MKSNRREETSSLLVAGSGGAMKCGALMQEGSKKLAKLARFVHVEVVHLSVDGVTERASARYHSAHVGV